MTNVPPRRFLFTGYAGLQLGQVRLQGEPSLSSGSASSNLTADVPRRALVQRVRPRSVGGPWVRGFPCAVRTRRRQGTAHWLVPSVPGSFGSGCRGSGAVAAVGHRGWGTALEVVAPRGCGEGDDDAVDVGHVDRHLDRSAGAPARNSSSMTPGIRLASRDLSSGRITWFIVRSTQRGGGDVSVTSVDASSACTSLVVGAGFQTAMASSRRIAPAVSIRAVGRKPVPRSSWPSSSAVRSRPPVTASMITSRVAARGSSTGSSRMTLEDQQGRPGALARRIALRISAAPGRSSRG